MTSRNTTNLRGGVLLSLILSAFFSITFILIATIANISTSNAYAATASASISGTSNVSMTITPGSSGATVVGSTRINFSVSNAISYRLALSSNSTGTTMTSTNTNMSTESIPSIGSSGALINFATNAWGFCVNTGTTACTASNTFNPIRASSNTYTLTSGTLSSSTNYAASGTRTLTYGVKIYNTLAAGTYSNTQIISLTAEDKPDTLEYVAYMQDMTTEVCSNTRTPTADETTTVPTTQLIDSRDGKKYWVAKLADGNCWMTQNLALDLSTSVTLTPSNTDISSNWTPPNSTQTALSVVGNSGSNHSFNLGDYVAVSPNSRTNLCSSNVAAISSCSGIASLIDVSSGYSSNYTATGTGTEITAISASNKSYDAHYHLGNYYGWNIATAQSSVTSNNATGSICPKGWKLPRANVSASTSGSFRNLFSVYSISSNAAGATAIGSAPLYLVRNGSIGPSTARIRNINLDGSYYSSTMTNATQTSNGTIASAGAIAYYTAFSGTTVTASDDNASFGKSNLRSVRCLTR